MLLTITDEGIHIDDTFITHNEFNIILNDEMKLDEINIYVHGFYE